MQTGENVPTEKNKLNKEAKNYDNPGKAKCKNCATWVKCRSNQLGQHAANQRFCSWAPSRYRRKRSEIHRSPKTIERERANPAGSTCRTCTQFKRCTKLFIGKDGAANVNCHFSPTRYRYLPTADGSVL